ncbi:hypothetical protein M758_5G142700 [Ceratodon purpureus]|uniref:Uncharacterized protein n=1 Tax=Ceratodon purpureus TaxID=3225 RepID=A0A8T0I460_CERPU|nr:hypothetical protein KC19_5G148900 [Ceratodon purpureus]KAG0616801.1 hypothetical protein M758_5G142700 [Ceratodon purpureus]
MSVDSLTILMFTVLFDFYLVEDDTSPHSKDNSYKEFFHSCSSARMYHHLTPTS